MLSAKGIAGRESGAPSRFVRLLLMDSHRMLTDVLAARLSASREIWVAGTCALDDPRLTELVRTLRPDVITTEVGRDPVDTGRMLRALRETQPGVHLVMLTDTHDTAHAVAAAREGAAAWVPKESSVEHLLGVVRAVCQGHACYPARQLGAVLRELRDDIRHARDRSDRLDVLSDREREVLLGMINGKPVNQIAADSLISPHTVRTHVRSIFTKLGVHSRLEAVRVAREAGLRPAPTLLPIPRPPSH
ncbi:MAG TPA: response regulator transcription factor [Pseudonocardiaceae bacterium]|nr:response regulator transcription factor [Pseudonocardiaceae bacterium]